jgi:hypothetical protein
MAVSKRKANSAPPLITLLEYNAVTPVLNDQDTIAPQCDASGNFLTNVIAGGGSGSNAAAGATGAGVPTSADYVGFNSGGNLVGVSAANPLPVSASFGAAATGGASTFHLIAAGSGDANNVKASAGTVYGWSISNTSGAPIYVKLYNSASAPTAGSGTIVRTIEVQAGVPVHFSSTTGFKFGTGIGFTIVTGIADNNSTGVTAATVSVDLDYA